jgi:hypothetical protein
MISKIVAALLTVLLLAAVCLAADKIISDDMIYDNVRIKLASHVRGRHLESDCKQCRRSLWTTAERLRVFCRLVV